MSIKKSVLEQVIAVQNKKRTALGTKQKTLTWKGKNLSQL